MIGRSLAALSMVGFVWTLTPTFALAGNCLSRPEPFLLQADMVQWSMVVGRGSECIQGLRGRTMVLESVSVLEQPKVGQLVAQGPSFRYSAGPDAGSDSFKILVVGASTRIHGSSVVTVNVQVR